MHIFPSINMQPLVILYIKEFSGYGAEIIYTQPVLYVIAGIVCIDETYANSLLAVYVCIEQSKNLQKKNY